MARRRLARRARRLTFRSGRLEAATAPAAVMVRRVFFLTRVVASLPGCFLLETEMATAPSCSATPTVSARLARPEYL